MDDISKEFWLKKVAKKDKYIRINGKSILDYNSAYGMVIKEIQRLYEKEYR